MRKNIFISFKIIYPTVPNVTLYVKIKSIGRNLCTIHCWQTFSFKQFDIIVFINLMVTRNDRDLVRIKYLAELLIQFISILYWWFQSRVFNIYRLPPNDLDLDIEGKNEYMKQSSADKSFQIRSRSLMSKWVYFGHKLASQSLLVSAELWLEVHIMNYVR